MPNRPDAANPATAFWLTIDGKWRRVADLERWGNPKNRPLAKAVIAAVGAFGIFLTAAAGETNTALMPYTLSTTAPSCFCADSGIAAIYYKFDTNGTYVLIQKEHSGVWPVHAGKWVQVSNGIVTMTATNLPNGGQLIEKMAPMSYKQRVFLVWPGKKYKADALRVCRRIDSGTNEGAIHNEFMISPEEFAKGTGKPYGSNSSKR